MKTVSTINSVFLLIFICFLLGCKENARTIPHAANNDSVSNPGVSIKQESPIRDSTAPGLKNKRLMVERGRFSNEKYTVSVSTIYDMPDKPEEDSSYYRVGNYLYLVNNKTKIRDSIKLDEDPDQYVNITDESVLLGGASPLFRISWIGDSDMGMNQYWGLKDASWQMLFDIEYLVDLKRADELTLTGMVMGRDELVANFEEYPVTVSLKDYEVKIEKPMNQEIGYTTNVLSRFTAYKITDRKPYLLKRGTEITIDSINRKTNSVRIMTKDSTFLIVPFSAIKGNVQVNAAG
jgi:hypothetical protein